MKALQLKIILFIAAYVSSFGIACAQQVATEEPSPKIFFKNIEKDELPTRQLLDKGDTLEVFYDTCAVNGKIQFKEVERNSKIYDDFSALARKIINDKGDKVICGVVSQSYITKYKRSEITVTATSSEGKVVGTKTLIVGPKEHFSLALDLPVNNRKTLKYDSASSKLLPQDEAPLLYLSLNVTPGDVLASGKEAKWKDKVSVKFLIEASSHPLNSYGVALGYDLGDFNSLIDLKGVSIFGGYFRAKEDSVINGVAVPNQGRKNSWRFGLSYDLGTALKWAKF